VFFVICRTGPLYRFVAYDTVCFNGTEGLYFVSITQFCIVTFAMIMITLRFALTPTVVDETAEEQSELATPVNDGKSGRMMNEQVESVAPADRDGDKNANPTMDENVESSAPVDVVNNVGKIKYQSTKAPTETVVSPANGGTDINTEMAA
jgi:hypothetical protein